MTTSDILSVIAAVATPISVAVGLWIKSYFDIKRDEMTREQNRKDAAALAALTESQNRDVIDKAQEILVAGEQRKQELLKEVSGVKAVAIKSALKSQEAINISNGHNEKIAQAVDVSRQVLEKLSSPMEVSVTNDAEHPVPVESK